MTDALRGCLLVLALLAGSGEFAAAQPVSKGLRRSLALQASGRWRDAPLKPSIERLADAFSTSLWIDRRIDPTAKVTLSAPDGTLASLLDEFAVASSGHATPFDRLVYVGPKRSAAALPVVAQQWRVSPPAGMKQRKATAWPRLTTPRAIAQSIAEETGCRLANADAIPHDLWPAGETPKMTAGDRLTLVLIGFDLRWMNDPKDRQTIRCEPINYATMPKTPAKLASMVDGKRQPEAAEQRFTLRVVEQPFHAVMKQLAGQLGRKLVIDESLSRSIKRVSFQVEMASFEELLEAIGKSAGVVVRGTDKEIVVETAESPRKTPWQ